MIFEPMADNTDNTSFSVKEKYSYAYVDGKYAKIAVNAGGAATLADPLTWSYAETHSYVEVDPSSIGVSVPSGVSKVFAKVIYTIGAGGSGGGSSDDHQASMSAYVTKDELSAALAGVDVVIPANVATTDYVLEQMATITVPTSVYAFADSYDFATTGYVQEQLAAITVPASVSELTNDLGFATSAYVDEAIANAAPPEVYVPSALSDLENDIELIPSSIIEEMISSKVDAVEIPSKVSDLENDADYVPRSMIDELSIQFSNRLLQLEASIPNRTANLGDRTDESMTNNVQLLDRADDTEVIDFGSRLGTSSQPSSTDDVEIIDYGSRAGSSMDDAEIINFSDRDNDDEIINYGNRT